MIHTYQPIGTGECWKCGESFFKHIKHSGEVKPERNGFDSHEPQLV